MNNNRDYTIDIAKGIAIFLVVWGHVIQYSIAPTGKDFFSNPVFQVIYSFHMPLFMFISGYLSIYSLKRRSLKENLNNKIKGILIPYILWTIIITLIIGFIEFINKDTFNLLGFAKLIVSNFVVYPNIWFLYILFIFYCMLFATVYIEKKIGKIAFVILPILISVIPFESYFGTHYIQFFYIFFLAGYLVNRYKIKDKKQVGKNIKLILFAVLIVAYVALLSQWDRTDYIYINLMELNERNSLFSEVRKVLYRFTIAFTGIALVVLVSGYINKLKFSNVLKSLGKYTLEIYLIQNIIVSLMYRQLVEIYGYSINFDSLVFIVYCLFIATISILLCIWISKGAIQKNDILNVWLFGVNKKAKVDNETNEIEKENKVFLEI